MKTLSLAGFSLLLMTIWGASCERRSPLASFIIEEGSETLTCGTIDSPVTYRILGDKNVMTGKFALLLGGSPVVEYFTDSDIYDDKNQGDYSNLGVALIKQGYRILELKYDAAPEGFYAACYRQGLDNVAKYCGVLYDFATQKLGFDASNKDQSLVAAGWSIGAIQAQTMTFLLNKRIDRVALTGVLLGNVIKGCQHGWEFGERMKSALNGWGYGYFMAYADALTRSGFGCNVGGYLTSKGYSPSVKEEYTEQFNFENLPYFNKKIPLGLFEGFESNGGLPPDVKFLGGNYEQAKYIAEMRKKAGVHVLLKTYTGCGHAVLNCAPDAGKDIVDFLTKPGL